MFALLAGVRAAAQEPPVAGSRPSLAERQESIRTRVQQLENRLLMLGRVLAETEPEKAERLRQALQESGQRQVARRLDRLAQLFRHGRLGDAEQEQVELLADLGAVLSVLTDTATDLDRRRAERERLDGFRRAIDSLQEGQLDALYRTRAAGGEAASQPASGELDELERAQRLLERQAADLAGKMGERGPSAGRAAPAPTPGQRQVEAARQHMQDAAQRLEQQVPDEAQTDQQSALEQLRRAQDELEDALRQVRREEVEETLAALETRFRSLLARERQVRSDVAALAGRPVDGWTRAEQLRMAELARAQHGAADDAAVVQRILVSEATTVVLPDLVEHLAADMREVAGRLDHADTSSQCQTVLDGIVNALEEIVAAIETQRNADREDAAQPGGDGGPADRPLLPPSAELKLLRASQLRVNRQTAELEDKGDTRPNDERSAGLERLAGRQRQLAEMAARMNERP